MVNALVTGIGVAVPTARHQAEVWDGFFREHFAHAVDASPGAVGGPPAVHGTHPASDAPAGAPDSPWSAPENARSGADPACGATLAGGVAAGGTGAGAAGVRGDRPEDRHVAAAPHSGSPLTSARTGGGPPERAESGRALRSPRAFARRIFDGAGVSRRHTVVDLVTERDWHLRTTAERMRRYTREAPPLGHRAVSAALADAGLDPGDVGQLTVVSCTGYDTPGLDIRLAASLGLRADTQRLLIGHMGCYAALPGLGGAADYAVARRRPAVLLCLELSSLHVQPPTTDPQQIVTHALFGDAAVALVVRPPDDPGAGGGARGGVRLLDIAAHTDTGTQDRMTWRVTDQGFRMGLSPEVPDVLAKHVRPVVENLLAPHGLRPEEVAGWAVHPGGPRILDTVEEQLALRDDALADSRAVLDGFGNCSSATVLLVLERMLRRGAVAPGSVVVAMAFGPGLTLYAALLRVDGGTAGR